MGVRIVLTGSSLNVEWIGADSKGENRGLQGSPGLRAPSGPWVREDSGAYQGYTIPRFYDTMIAKLIVWGRDRPTAIARMARALAEYRIVGVRTTIPVLEKIIASDDFRAGLTAVVSLSHPDPLFESQTKIKLNNPEVDGIVTSVVYDFPGRRLGYRDVYQATPTESTRWTVGSAASAGRMSSSSRRRSGGVYRPRLHAKWRSSALAQRSGVMGDQASGLGPRASLESVDFLSQVRREPSLPLLPRRVDADGSGWPPSMQAAPPPRRGRVDGGPRPEA